MPLIPNDAITILYVPVTGTIITGMVKRDYKEFRRLIGYGWLEASSDTENKWTVWCDEEGKLKGLPFNERATIIANNNKWSGAGRDILVGNVFFTGPADEEGEALPVTEDIVTFTERVFQVVTTNP